MEHDAVWRTLQKIEVGASENETHIDSQVLNDMHRVMVRDFDADPKMVLLLCAAALRLREGGLPTVAHQLFSLAKRVLDTRTKQGADTGDMMRAIAAMKGPANKSQGALEASMRKPVKR